MIFFPTGTFRSSRQRVYGSHDAANGRPLFPTGTRRQAGSAGRTTPIRTENPATGPSWPSFGGCMGACHGCSFRITGAEGRPPAGLRARLDRRSLRPAGRGVRRCRTSAAASPLPPTWSIRPFDAGDGKNQNGGFSSNLRIAQLAAIFAGRKNGPQLCGPLGRASASKLAMAFGITPLSSVE